MTTSAGASRPARSCVRSRASPGTPGPGTSRPRTSSTSTSQATPRNLFGFKDGTANILADDTAALAERLGRTSIVRATVEQVREATGQAIRGVAPSGHPAPLPTVVDEALAAFPEIWAAGGTPHTVFPLTFDELVRLTGGTVTKVD